MLRGDSRYKSPLIASLMSLVLGLGQVYVGYYQQGFINIIVVAGIITILIHRGGNDEIKPFLVLFLIFYWLYNLVDAYRRATFYNQALAGLGPLELPEGEHQSAGRGSLFGGVALLVIGLIALSHTLFDLPLDWIEQWWPLAFVLMGVYLLYRSVLYKKQMRKN